MSDKYAILGMLQKEDLYGYEISRRLKDIEGFWYIFPGNLYRALGSLEKEGLVEVSRTEEHAGKLRKIYRITSTGLREFNKWVSKPAELPRTRHEAYLKIWFSSGNAGKVALQIEQIKAASTAIITAMDTVDFSTLPEHLRWMMEVGRRHVQVDVEWADSCLKALDPKRKDG